MPVKRGKDKFGYYYRCGKRKKYYYIKNNKISRENAYKKAKVQGIAITIHKKTH